MELKYENGLLPQFNGNISAQSWGSGLALPNMFNYEYDKLGRLSKAASTGIVMSEELNYDEMGNITGLNRDNSGMKLYNYDGNKLLIVNGLTGLYRYDFNGNVVKDGRNGMDLTYNSLNLPITANDGVQYMNYLYDATGRRLARYINGSVRTYINGIEAAEGNVDVIHTEEGVARNNGSGGYSYEYNLSDHLGNVRATFYQNPANQQTEVIQRDDYYAFGLRKMNSPNSNTNKYLYNGKELQEALGQYDYGARFYDPIIGRWNAIDAKAELYFNWSPYTYALNTPTNAVDPDGHLVIFINGNHYGGGGTRSYWQTPSTITERLILGYDGQRYTGYNVVPGKDFAGAVMGRLNDHHDKYVDGAGAEMKGGMGSQHFYPLVFQELDLVIGKKMVIPRKKRC